MDAGEQERRRKEAEALFVGKSISVTSDFFETPVVFERVLGIEPGRGIPFGEAYQIFGIVGGNGKYVGFWEEHHTCINILG